VVYADTHGGTLNPSIDYTVYQRLMTPNGVRCEDPEMHFGKYAPMGTATYDYRALPPLAEKDFQ